MPTDTAFIPRPRDAGNGNLTSRLQPQDADGVVFGDMVPEDREQAVIFVRALVVSSDMARQAAVVKDFRQLYPVCSRFAARLLTRAHCRDGSALGPRNKRPAMRLPTKTSRDAASACHRLGPSRQRSLIPPAPLTPIRRRMG